MIYFFDSSALVKRYVSETGTDWVRNIFAGAKPEEVFISKISGAEVVAAFARILKKPTPVMSSPLRDGLTFTHKCPSKGFSPFPPGGGRLGWGGE